MIINVKYEIFYTGYILKIKKYRFIFQPLLVNCLNTYRYKMFILNLENNLNKKIN